MSLKNTTKGGVGDVLIIIVAILFLLIVFKIDVIGWLHGVILKIAAALS